MNYQTCPVSLRGEREFYLKEIAGATRRIKLRYRQLAQEELSKRPVLRFNPRWRSTSQCKPKDVRRILGSGAFEIKVKPGTGNDRRDIWVQFLMGSNN